jgi:hypothetical protein
MVFRGKGIKRNENKMGNPVLANWKQQGTKKKE